MKRVLVVGESDELSNPGDLAAGEFDAVVLAFWASPEFGARMVAHGAKVCWRLNELVRAYGETARRAYGLAHEVAMSAPTYREVNPLLAWENVLATALMTPLVMAELHAALAERAGGEAQIVFASRNDTQRAFETVNANRAPRFETGVLHDVETNKAHAAGGRWAAWLALAAEARRDGDRANVFWAPVEVLDSKYAVRARARWGKRGGRNENLFYSSYVNFSRALGRHAAGLEEAPQWVVNSHSARKGLPRGAKGANLWEWGTPRQAGHREHAAQASEAVRKAAEERDGFPLRAALAASGAAREITERVTPVLLAEIDLMHACLERVGPRTVWTANQWGGEGCMLQAAHARGAAVTQVQHGMPEQYYLYAPLYSERFLVWDAFAAGLVNGSERERVEISTPEGWKGTRPRAFSSISRGARITYFSAPPQVVAFWNPSVTYWEVATLLKALVARGQAVTLRAHPMDRLGAYAAEWRGGGEELPKDLTLNKGTPLEPLLERTDLAMMVFSTVAFECAARGIPVLGMGWYEFAQKTRVQEAGYIRYADSLEELITTEGGGEG